MKSIGILVFLFFVPSIFYAQQVVVPDKKWEGLYAGNTDNYFQSKFRDTFTEIDGSLYLELMYKVDDGWFEGVRQYFRQEGEKVYRLQEGEEKLMLDFGLMLGDTLEIVDDFGNRFEFFPIRTVDTTIFNQQLRKLEMRVKPENEPVSNVPHVWIEGVGDTGFFFGSGYVFGNLNATPIFCVRDNGQFFSAGIECPDLLSSYNPIDSEVPNFIYDPTNKMIIVKDERVVRLDLYSLSGERIQSFTINKNNSEINLSSISQKYCVMVLFDGKNYHSKILKR